MSSLLFCTASSSYKLFSVPIEPLDVLIIDEAAQLKECESIIPFQLPGLRLAILAGDEYQLPAMVKSHLSGSVGFGRSIFHRLGLLGWSKHLLNMQYRVHPSVSAFPRRMFYRNKVIDAPNVKSETYEKRYLEGSLFGPYSFINISEGKEETDDNGLSRKNMVEAAVVRDLVLRLYKGWCQSPCNQKLSIGVISPYAAQVKEIEKMIGEKIEKVGNFAVNIKSIDGFQGAEEDVILISTVRSNSVGDIGFLSNYQRLNVALTRARHCLWVLGHEKTLAKANYIWRALIADAKERKCFFNANEDERIEKVIIHVKEELEQLDDLLNGDSILFRSARWKVLFASNFIKSFSKLPSSFTKKCVLNIIVKLSNGWRPKKIKLDPVCESYIRIVKQYKVRCLYVICTNDLVKETEYVQVLKVWDILPLEAVTELVERVGKIYSSFTEDFVRRCKEQCFEGNLEVPLRWSSNSDIVRYKSNISTEGTSIPGSTDIVPSCIEKTGVRESLLLMKFYSLSAGVVKHLLSVSDGSALDLPFEVTDNQWEIINYPRSSFVLGRSGSGKTIVLLMKLFQKEQLYHVTLDGPDEVHTNASLCDDSSVKTERTRTTLRQLFVTLNPNLCYSVKQQISNLQRYARGEIEKEEVNNLSLDETGQFEDIPNSFLEIPAESYPLVVSLKKFLLILDGTIGTSYFHRFVDIKQTSCRGTASSKSVLLQIERKEVSFDKFSTSYWPHFNSKLTKQFDPSRVFTEILSCIKGRMQVEHGRLSSDSYIQLSDKRISSLGRSERPALYDIFLSYEKMKLKRGEFDLADLVNDLHDRLSHQTYEGDSMDFVFVDEVQDLTVMQLALFKYVCKNVEQGFVFAGDTAQTIARGVDFRFEEIKDLFYTKFLQGSAWGKNSKKGSEAKVCPTFQLSQNFRSHAGILRVAHSVIQLIYHYFPNSVDILDPEFSVIDGEAPTLFESLPGEDVVLKIFQNNEKDGTNMVSFGAEQVILVRDESVRDEIPNYVKGHALVLTVFECKGLEFKDVLLYNFFSSSSIREHWSVIYEYMLQKNLGTLFPHFPSFNHAKHSGLCHELKQLYVAITRAKERLWICENQTHLSEPIANYWKKLNLVHVRQFDDSLAQEMVFTSSKEEWKSRGFKFLEVSNYETATICFERAGDRYWEKVSRATGLKTAASRVRGLKSEAVVMLTQAAEIFESIGNHKEAATCFYEAKEYERAGDIYLQHYRESELETACHCYSLGGLHSRVAKIYAEKGFFNECLHACKAGNLFELGLQYVQSWKRLDFKGSIDLITEEEELLKKCARASYQTKDKIKMMKFVKQLSSQDSMRKFLKSLQCYNELIDLEEEWGNIQEAILYARKIGYFLREADLLEKIRMYEDASRLYLWYVFASSRWSLSGKRWPEKDFPLLLKAEASAREGSSILLGEVRTEIMLVSSQSNGLSELKRLLLVSQSQERGNLKWEIILNRRIIDTVLHQFAASPYEWESALEEMMCSWKFWKGEILAIMEHIECSNTGSKAQSSSRIYWDFCQHYFGVRKIDSGYFLLYPDAEWVTSSQRSNQTIGTNQLVTAIRCYWCSELLSVGLKILEFLESLQKLFYDSMPMICKSRILVQVFECSQFLMESEDLRKLGQVSSAPTKFIDRATKRYVAAAFSMELHELILLDQTKNRSSIITRKLKVKLDL